MGGGVPGINDRLPKLVTTQVLGNIGTDREQLSSIWAKRQEHKSGMRRLCDFAEGFPHLDIPEANDAIIHVSGKYC